MLWFEAAPNRHMRLLKTAAVLALWVSLHHTADAETRILAFGDSNTWGWSAVPEGYPAKRLADRDRWPGVLEDALGAGTVVIVDGLVGRRTDIDGEAVGIVAGEAFNGSRALPAAIARNQPIDLVIIMLGTNDVQSGIGRTPEQIAVATVKLAEQVRASQGVLFSGYAAPRVLVVAPPPLADTSRTPLAALFRVGEPLSHRLGQAMAVAGAQAAVPVPVFDAARAVPAADGVDGIHLSREGHRRLGEALAGEARRILNQ